MAITTFDDILTATPQRFSGFFIGSASANQYYASHNGSNRSSNPGSVPTSGSGQTCDNTTSGAMPFSSPGAGKSLYLARFVSHNNSTSSSVPNSHILLMDRLVASSGLSAASALSQTVNSVALPTRGGSGEGCELWIETYSDTGATERTLTVNYTNSAGAASSTSVTFPGTSANNDGPTFQVPLAAGDLGIQSVQSVQLSASTGAAGDFGITIYKRYLESYAPTGNLTTNDPLDIITLGMPQLPDDVSLSVVHFSALTSPNLDYEVTLLEG